MLIRNHVPFQAIFKTNWLTFIAVVSYSALISYLYENSTDGIKDLLDLPPFVPAILGTSLAFFLGFITNSAYDRWWEARKRWGTIVNDSRNLARELATLIKTDDSEEKKLIKKMVYRQIAWCYTLKHQLRKQDTSASLQRILGKGDMDSFNKYVNKPFAIMTLQAHDLKGFETKNRITIFDVLQIDSTMNRLTDHQGALERIKGTIFPTQYSFFVHLFIILFLVLIPHGAVETMGWWTLPLTFIIAFVYLMIETIEVSMHDPFDMEPSDTPMSAICRTIEIDLMQLVGDKKIPGPVLPVDGIVH